MCVCVRGGGGGVGGGMKAGVGGEGRWALASFTGS